MRKNLMRESLEAFAGWRVNEPSAWSYYAINVVIETMGNVKGVIRSELAPTSAAPVAVLYFVILILSIALSDSNQHHFDASSEK